MPSNRKEYDKQYYQKNREKILERKKEYKEQQKVNQKKYSLTDKFKANQKKYLQSDLGKEKQKRYRQSEKGKKFHRIRNWKRRGILSDNYDELYEEYINTQNCDICGVQLVENKFSVPNRRCLDHDHETGAVRYICCQSCNTILR